MATNRTGITVEETLSMDIMKNSKVLAGGSGLQNIVSNVNVMADPDVMKWVEGGEFLLTTGYALNKMDIYEQKELIKQAKDITLAAIGIKVKPYLDELPEQLLKIADDNNLPIIEIDENISISEITTPILKEIFDRQSLLLQKIENIYEQFMEAMLKSTDIKGLIELTSQNIKNPIILKLDFPKKLIKEYSTADDYTEITIEKSMNAFYLDRYIRKEKKIHQTKEFIKEKVIDRVIIPIIANENVYGHIFAWGLNSPLSGYEMSVMEIASTTIALEVLKALSVKEVENRYKSEFIEDLISEEDKRNKKSIDRIGFFNLKKDDYYFCITAKLRGMFKKGNINENVISIQQYISKLNDKLEVLSANKNIKCIIGNKMDQVPILISFNKDNYDYEKKRHADILPDLEKAILEIEDVDIGIGVGRIYKGINNFRKSYLDSIFAIDTGKILNHGKVTIFSKLGIYQLLSQDCLGNELRRFYEETLKPLVDYDESKSTELTRTLESYFNNNGNLKKMSDELFTHYNTVLYRVHRIEEITGMSLDNESERLDLNVALKIKKLIS
ncbi:MAG: PucR family transcriptional regulator ligand-binding domain-containing protein [Andreesenia angusta]|nr:PucR family transcriptional regulator ligand-binding domain-containing protein [Andreesenia angusta]